MQSQNNLIEKSEITMHLSIVEDHATTTVEPSDTNLTIQTIFQKSSFIEPCSDSESDEEEEKEEAKPVPLALKHFGTFELELKKVQISNEKKNHQLND